MSGSAVSREGWKLITLLRLSPIVPWNMLNYALAITGKLSISGRAAAALSTPLPACAAACPGYVMKQPALRSMAAVFLAGSIRPSMSGSARPMHCSLKSTACPFQRSPAAVTSCSLLCIAALTESAVLPLCNNPCRPCSPD